MSSTMSNRQSTESKYLQIPLNDAEDVVELRKAQTTAPLPSGVLNHPALPVACYCVASIMMTVMNKYVVSGANFNMTCLLLAIQSSVCIAVVRSVKAIGVIEFQDFDMTVAKKWFPISFMLASVIYTGSKSLQYLSIPVFTIFKNLTIILIAYGEVLWFGGRVTRLTLVSFLIMVLSSVIAAWSDISITLEGMASAWSSVDTGSGSAPLPVTSILANISGGYFWMFFNCISTAAYVLTMRKRIKAMGFSDWDTMFYNNLLSIPVLVVFSVLVENWSMENLAKNFPPDNRQILLSAIAFSGAAAVGISYTTAWCLRATSSTTYSMVGALNKLPIAASGMVFFGDPITLGSVSAVSVGFFAGIMYAIAKNNQVKADRARAAQSTEIPLHHQSKS